MSTAALQLSRRRVLGLASSAGSAGAWASPLGNSQALAAHLLRRAGFGYTDAPRR